MLIIGIVSHYQRISRAVLWHAQRALRSQASNLWGPQLFIGYEYNCWDVG